MQRQLVTLVCSCRTFRFFVTAVRVIVLLPQQLFSRSSWGSVHFLCFTSPAAILRMEYFQWAAWKWQKHLQIFRRPHWSYMEKPTEYLTLKFVQIWWWVDLILQEVFLGVKNNDKSTTTFMPHSLHEWQQTSQAVDDVSNSFSKHRFILQKYKSLCPADPSDSLCPASKILMKDEHLPHQRSCISL